MVEMVSPISRCSWMEEPTIICKAYCGNAILCINGGMYQELIMSSGAVFEIVGSFPLRSALVRAT